MALNIDFSSLAGMSNTNNKYGVPIGQNQIPTAGVITPPTIGTTIGTGPNQVDVAAELGKRLNATPISYTPQTMSQMVPQNVTDAANASLAKITNYNPTPVNLSSDYWNKTLNQMLTPMQTTFERAREQMRGDQAAQGNIYDSAGGANIEKLGADYLTQIGQATSGVETAREKQAADDAKWQAEQQLAGAQAGTQAAGNQQQLYSATNLAQNQLGTTTALQNKASDNSLLGGAMDLTGSLNNSNVGAYTAATQAASSEANTATEQYKAEQAAQDALRQRWIDYLNLQGYGDATSGSDYGTVGSKLGLPTPTSGPGSSDTVANPQNLGLISPTGAIPKAGDVMKGNDGRYYQMGLDGKVRPTGY